jgi:hypothetical protein
MATVTGSNVVEQLVAEAQARLEASEPEEWQVGVLREGDNAMVELQPPPEDLDLGEVAERIGRMRITTAPPRTAQFGLLIGDAAVDAEAECDEEAFDDGLCF